MSTDERGMFQALALALKGQGFVEPNPMVGAVVLDTAGQLVGEGWHERFGEAHAEVNALSAAGERAKGGTLYVTLEPCCHTGKTPPCTDAVIHSGVKRVVVAMSDPFPQVAGKGIAILREAGIAVDVGIGESEARALNAPYLKLVTTGKPWIHCKWAMTLDGKIATHTGDSQWISNTESRTIVHQLRSRMDAIVVGAATVRQDDPSLTARPEGARLATRVVITSRGDLPNSCKLLNSARQIPVLVFVAHGYEVRLKAWSNAGAEVVAMESIEHVLNVLGQRRMTNILVEGGSELLGSFFDAGFGDEIHAFIAPSLIGGRDARSPIGGKGLPLISDARKITPTVQTLGSDVYIHGRFR